MLNELADTMELLGEDRYRVASYRDAATHVEHYAEPIENMARDNRIAQIHGIGKSIGGKIAEYLSTGRLDVLEERRARVPPAALTLMRISGIGPKRAMLLARELQVHSVQDLQVALESGQVAALPRLGEKTASSILEELRRLDTRSRRLPLAIALPAVEQVVRELGGCGAVDAIAPAGSIRRFRDSVGDIDILVTSSEPRQIMAAFTSLGLVKQVLSAGDTRASILTHADLQIDLRVVPHASFGAALQYFTGSQQHNVKLREIAIRKGYKLNEYGLFEGEASIAGADEQGIYAAPRLSDGSSSILEMVEAGAAAGYAYLAITDHSQALGVAGGMPEHELREEHARIRELQDEFPDIALLCGVEVDIHVDERLDCSDEFLASCDLVVASIHSALQKPPEVQTARLLAAIENPHVDIIAHPTGRLVGKRPGYEIDLPTVLDACARTRTAIEVSGQPERLDLDADSIRAAIDRGVLLALDTDAHEQSQVGNLMRYAVGNARRGWATATCVVNAMTYADLRAWLDRR